MTNSISVRLKKFAVFALMFTGISVATVSTGVITSETVEASEITRVPVEKQLITGLPKYYSSNEFVIAHESGNPNNVGTNSLYNEVAYMTNNWQNAFVTHWVGSGGKVIQTASTGFGSWGAGGYANYRSYAQVELARTNNADTFKKDYSSYVNLLRQLATEAGLPLTVDTGGKGVKSHLWVTQNLGGTDHTDPYSYLASWGVSKAQFANDVANGIAGTPAANTGSNSSTGSTSNSNSTSAKPAPSAPAAYAVTAHNVAQSVDVNGLNIRTAQNTSAKVIGQLNAGQTFNATRICKNGQNVNGYTTWFEVNGVGWVSGSYVTPVKSTVSTPVVPTPAKPAETGWVAESATFYPNCTINVRSAASTGSSVVAQYQTGQSVTYDSYKVSGGYVWIHYVSYSGQDRYMAIRTYSGSAGQLWGTIY